LIHVVQNTCGYSEAELTGSPTWCVELLLMPSCLDIFTNKQCQFYQQLLSSLPSLAAVFRIEGFSNSYSENKNKTFHQCTCDHAKKTLRERCFTRGDFSREEEEEEEFILQTCNYTKLIPIKQEFVRPRWPYDMRPSVRAEKYIRDASG